MGNVIHANFDQSDDGTGYLLEDVEGGKKKITGVYVGDISAASDGDNIMIGAKVEQGIDHPVFLTMEEMNQFCIMWLCIFNPEVIAEDIMDEK